jgi:hypothetical protein
MEHLETLPRAGKAKSEYGKHAEIYLPRIDHSENPETAHYNCSAGADKPKRDFRSLSE